jgi:hypothetical protein
LLEGK